LNYSNNKTFYTSAIKLYGTSAKGVNWHSKQTQNIRFKTILDFLPLDISTCSVADAGCGFGDFYNYMLKKKKTPSSYIGLDFLDEMCTIAEQNTAKEILLKDICKDKLPFADYYVCSGAMNTLSKFDTHLFIQNCYATCREGFVFNILHGDKESETYNYMNLQEIQDIASSLHVEHVVLKDGYLENDITVGFFKRKREDI
jgi:SAM-dependent methyltransferase